MVRMLWMLAVLAAVPLAGYLYQRVGGWRDRRRFIGHGEMVEVGDGLRLYMSRKGVGGPAVIFESGIAATSQNWAELQERVSEFATAVTYDRGGLGWSGESVSERTPGNIVRELRGMLRAAGIEPPYVLVGHSFGGLVVRKFAAEHPEEVVGVVLVDAMRTEEWPPVNGAQAAMVERGMWLAEMGVVTARVGLARLAITSLLCRSGRVSRMAGKATGVGGMHVLERVTCEVGKMPREVWPIVAAHWASPRFYRGLREHLRGVAGTVVEMHEAGAIVGIPVVLITAGSAEAVSEEGMRRIGPGARQIVARRSGHWVHLDEPDLVMEEIRGMIEEVRAGDVADVEVLAGG